MGIFGNGGLSDVIRCDLKSYLVWKWHPEGSEKGASNRENEIRFGSRLRVKDGEIAVFVYKQKDGTMQDIIEGPFDETIKTKNFPILSSLLGLLYDGNSPFQAEIYFINLAEIIQTRFGVPYFDVFDPRFEDFGVPVSVRGTISYKITDYKEFIKLHRLIDFNFEDFQRQIKDIINRYVKDLVVSLPIKENIPLVQIESKTDLISEKLKETIGNKLKENFGVTVSTIDVSDVEVDKNSDGYIQLRRVTKDITSATVEAETEAKLKDISEKQRIEMADYEERLRMQREEAQYAQHLQSQSSNIKAFEIDKKAQVGIAGAEALGKMGENGAGSISMGGDSSLGMGFNPASMMASMALGGAVGQNIANTMNNVMSNMNNQSTNQTPPPVPVVSYNVVINGEAKGPFDKNVLKQMVASSQIDRNTLVWKSGMTDWQKAEIVDDLKDIFEIPPIPNNK